jgi:4'-phosphopantetheinyl transferase
MEGFFSAWSRKEAYLKATGHGISRGLDHFDVTLSPGEPARLLADRLEPHALTRWAMTAVPVGAGYSAALVVEGTLDDMLLLDA